MHSKIKWKGHLSFSLSLLLVCIYRCSPLDYSIIIPEWYKVNAESTVVSQVLWRVSRSLLPSLYTGCVPFYFHRCYIFPDDEQQHKKMSELMPDIPPLFHPTTLLVKNYGAKEKRGRKVYRKSNKSHLHRPNHNRINHPLFFFLSFRS